MANTASPSSLGNLEFRLNSRDDGIEQLAKDGVARRDASAEVDAVGMLDTRHEGGKAGDVGQ
jgi:hypothetical protein